MSSSSDIPAADHDAYWKDAFDAFLPQLVEFLTPDVHAAIDWSCGYTPTTIELHPDSADSATGKRFPDRLYEVRLRSGEPAILFLHVEFQSYAERDFDERMFVYRVRLFLHLRAPIVSLAFLVDADPDFRPSAYREERFGDVLSFQFRTVKLLDYAGQEEALLDSGNVAAILVAIKLIDMREKLAQQRSMAKLRVLRKLATVVRDRKLVPQLTRFLIQGIMLPRALGREFYREVRMAEKEFQMPFITIYEAEAEARGEARGEARAKQQDILRILRARFQAVAPAIVERITAIDDAARLDAFVDLAVTMGSLEEFSKAVE